MTTHLRAGMAALAALLVVVLTACGGLPTTGPVNAGRPIDADESNSDLVFLPDGPAKDATPQQIVEGFIAAGAGPRNTWEKAREFLAPGTPWNPRASVIVYAPGDLDLQALTESEFVVSVTPTATVDASGALSGEGGEIPLSFTLAQQGDGQWRITHAPDGIVIDRNRFTRVYGNYALQFFDPTWTYLVPDQRWFPRLYAATSIAEALVDGGPSAWLDGAVSTAFIDGARLATTTVPQQSGIAAVSLQDGARGLDQTVLDRMQTQLEVSLDAAGIAGVDMLVDEQVLSAQSLPVRQTRIDSRPLVRTQDAFGFASAGGVEEIVGLSGAILQVDTSDIEVSADRTAAAVRDVSGVVLSVSGDGVRTRLDTRSDLIAPSIDPAGFVWSVPRSAPGALAAFRADGTRIDVASAWPGAAEVFAQRVSRDGTRIAAVIRDGDRYALWVAGIQRGRDDDAPTALGERKIIAYLSGPTDALTWIDASTVAVITTVSGDPAMITQEIGGFSQVQSVPTGVTTVAGGTASGGMRILDAAGELYGQQGANWQLIASGVLVLAVQQGSPR